MESHPPITPSPDGLDGQLARLEETIRRSASELRAVRQRIQSERREEIRDEWRAVHPRWAAVGLALLVAFVLAAYLFYMNLGWYADQRALPPSSDWLLDRLPTLNLVPLLTWGWLALHAWALAVAVLYHPRRLPFLLWLLGVYLCIRTLYVFLSPIGAPLAILDMRELDDLFAAVVGEYTFQNEFVFSGHTAMPFLFFLFLEHRRHRVIMLLGSLCMAVSVLLTKNHYAVDVLSAYLVGYAIYVASEHSYTRWLRPAFGAAPATRPTLP
jgi:hypothetical protein